MGELFDGEDMLSYKNQQQHQHAADATDAAAGSMSSAAKIMSFLSLLLLMVLSCSMFGSTSADDLQNATVVWSEQQNDLLYMVDHAPETESADTTWYDQVQELYVNGISQALPRYYETLQEWPASTKSVTGCIIGGLGDLLAQCIEIHVLASSQHYDPIRVLSVAFEGLFISGPLMHYSYEFLESIIPIDSSTGASNLEKWMAAIFQVLVDSLIMDCVFVATLMITTAILQGRTRQVGSELKLEYWNGVKVSWASSLLFAPLQCFLFRYVPLVYRVLAMNLQDTVWNACISYIAHRSRKDVAVKEKSN